MSTRYIARDRNIAFVTYYCHYLSHRVSLSTGTVGEGISFSHGLCNMMFPVRDFRVVSECFSPAAIRLIAI
jgi:hypothetical protein